MKFIESKSTISTASYGLAENLYSFYENIIPITGTDSSGNMLAEAVLQYVAHSTLNSFSADIPGITAALDFLNKKIEAARKTVSFWDAYQVRGTVESEDQFLGQLATMPANSAITSSLRDPFEWTDANNVTHMVYRGDIILKDYLEQLHYIPSLNTGFYVPTAANHVQGSSNTYTLTYEYKTEEVDSPSVIFEGLSNTWTGYDQTVTVNGRTAQDPGTIPSATIDLVSMSGTAIMPVVKVFMVKNDGGREQVFLDNTFTIESNKIKLSNTTFTQLEFEVK